MGETNFVATFGNRTRPMVQFGRHVEISSRVKHMPKLKERYALSDGGWITWSQKNDR